MSARIIPFRPRAIVTCSRRERIIMSCGRAAVMSSRDDMTEMWMRKARLASHLPTNDLTVRPAAVVDFTPGFDPREKASGWPWFSIMVLGGLAAALTPMGWLL